jgi:hypothetical protein
MLIDRAGAADQDFIRISGWTGNRVLMVEHEFLGADRVNDRRKRVDSGGSIVAPRTAAMRPKPGV